MGPVRLHGIGADDQSVGDLLTRAAFADQL
jgi:hypothetical protein